MSALTGLRVVELAESVAGEYCGKLLADFGAEVIKVEEPGCGSPTRAMAPVLGAGPEASALFAYLNTNKHSIALDIRTAAGAEHLHQLISTADAVIVSGSTNVAERHPSVVFCVITPFGQDAAPEFDNAKSINVFHASGWGYHTPSHADPSRPPLQGPGRFLVDYEAGLEAALTVASALFNRLHTGRGELIDISQHAVLVSRTDCILGRLITGEVPAEGSRDDYDQQGPASFFRCADGFVYLYVTSRAHWVGMKSLLGHPDWLDAFDDDWLEFSVTAEKWQRFSGDSPTGSPIYPKTTHPRKRSDRVCRWYRSTAQRIYTSHRSTVIAASFSKFGIPCWAMRHIRRCRTRSAHRRRESLLPHPLSGSTRSRCWRASIGHRHGLPSWRRNSSHPRIRAADRCKACASSN